MTSVDDWIAKYIGYVNKMMGFIPYKRMGVWKEFFFNPRKVAAGNIDSIGQRLKDLYVMMGIEVFLGILALLPLMAVFVLTGPISWIMMGMGAVIIVLAVVLGPILTFLYSLLEFAVAKALGGKGDMKANFNASVLPALSVFVITLPITAIGIPLAWLSMIPFVNICMSIVTMPLRIAQGLAGLYALYLKFLAFKEVHKLSDMRAAGVVLLPVVLLIMIVIGIAVLLYASFFAMIFGGAFSGVLAKLLRPG